MDPPPHSDENDDVFFSLNDNNSNDSTYYTPPQSSRFFDRFSFDSSEDEDDQHANDAVRGNSAVNMESTSKRLNYMLQFLDRKLSINPNSNSNSNSVLPEFLAEGGDSGIFRLPVRAAVHPNRPPSLDFRPHPLRETQVGSFLRTISATTHSLQKQQLWGCSECGLRCWDLSNLYAASAADAYEDTLPFCESVHTHPVLCLVVDEAIRVVWSGHKDGKIKCWKMDQIQSSDGYDSRSQFKEDLSWQAHRGPVLSLVITSYGKQ